MTSPILRTLFSIFELSLEKFVFSLRRSNVDYSAAKGESSLSWVETMTFLERGVVWIMSKLEVDDGFVFFDISVTPGRGY